MRAKRPKSKLKRPSAGKQIFKLRQHFGIEREIIFNYFCRRVLVTYISPDILLEGLQEEMRAICQFSLDQEFTMKWIDEEGLFLI